MIKIDNIKISARSNREVFEYITEKYSLKRDIIDKFTVLKKSLDARDKNDIKYVYSVCFEASKSEKFIVKSNKNASFYKQVLYKIPKVSSRDIKTVVVGFGPAGIFASYILVKAGIKPIILDRGSSIDIRTKEVKEFWEKNVLNENSNVQFGEGGAGTFSDGKLNTGIKDNEGRKEFILRTFVEHGAPENILYDSKPHIGTDILREVIKNIRNEIIKLGGEIRFNTRFDSLNLSGNVAKSVNVTNLLTGKEETIDTDRIILATGHSSRDTFTYLKNILQMEQKPFAMGFRVIHKQNLIDESQYGVNFKNDYPNLPVSPYKLTYQTNDEKRGVYSFCMCPGGFVVNASSEKESLCVNGMSYSKRDSGYANSALIVQILPKDLKSDDVLEGMYFQKEVERKAYVAGQSKIPVSSFKAFCGQSLKSDINPEEAIKGDFYFTNLKDIFPEFINSAFIEGMEHFNNEIKGFSDSNPLLAGVEARTSSPVKILRNEKYVSNIINIYPAGEGAGYAGGIISAAVDGIKVAEEILKG